MSLSELWFLLVAVLFVGFFFLEGFDFGVGMSTKFLARNDKERRILINTIGPFWDANEVWLITAGGAMFAAFPNWYATLFSGFYIPLVFVLLALIGRGVAFEFRSKVENSAWVKTWDWAIFLGSVLPPFLFGVVFANSLRGLPIDKDMELHATLLEMVNPYAILVGVTVVVLCLVHGLMFASLRTMGDLHERARNLAKKLILPLGVLLVAFVIMTYIETDAFAVRGAILYPIVAVIVLALILSYVFMAKKKDGWAFGMTGAMVVLSIASVFIGLFPRVMVSSLESAFDLTIHNASSSAYTLKAMTIVALTLLPFVLGYQIWSYYVFGKRISDKEKLEY